MAYSRSEQILSAPAKAQPLSEGSLVLMAIDLAVYLRQPQLPHTAFSKEPHRIVAETNRGTGFGEIVKGQMS